MRQRDTLSDTLYHNAAQNTLGVYTAGAGAMLGSGIQQYRKDPKEFATLGYGISSLVFKVASFMIPEKSKKESNGRNRGLLGGIVDWVREKPLRLFGWGSVITDSFLAVDAYKKYKHTPKESGNYVWKATTAATYIVADLLIAISSKDHANASGKLDADGQRRILAMAAEAIIREPQATRDSLTFEIAEFLATQPNVSGTAAELDKAIQEQLTQLGKNRWAQRAVASQEAAADTAQQPGR